MSGVFCQLAGALPSGHIALSSAGTPDWRQAIRSLPMVFLLMWSSEEYFVLPLSPEYAGQLWIFSSLPAPIAVAATAATITVPSNSIFFVTMYSTKEGFAGGGYFADANPSAHENSRNSSFGGDTFRYVRTEVKGSTSAFGSMDVIRSSRTPGDVNLKRSRTVN